MATHSVATGLSFTAGKPRGKGVEIDIRVRVTVVGRDRRGTEPAGTTEKARTERCHDPRRKRCVKYRRWHRSGTHGRHGASASTREPGPKAGAEGKQRLADRADLPRMDIRGDAGSGQAAVVALGVRNTCSRSSELVREGLIDIGPGGGPVRRIVPNRVLKGEHHRVHAGQACRHVHRHGRGGARGGYGPRYRVRTGRVGGRLVGDDHCVAETVRTPDCIRHQGHGGMRRGRGTVRRGRAKRRPGIATNTAVNHGAVLVVVARWTENVVDDCLVKGRAGGRWGTAALRVGQSRWRRGRGVGDGRGMGRRDVLLNPTEGPPGGSKLAGCLVVTKKGCGDLALAVDEAGGRFGAITGAFVRGRPAREVAEAGSKARTSQIDRPSGAVGGDDGKVHTAAGNGRGGRGVGGVDQALARRSGARGNLPGGGEVAGVGAPRRGSPGAGGIRRASSGSPHDHGEPGWRVRRGRGSGTGVRASVAAVP